MFSHRKGALAIKAMDSFLLILVLFSVPVLSLSLGMVDQHFSSQPFIDSEEEAVLTDPLENFSLKSVTPVSERQRECRPGCIDGFTFVGRYRYWDVAVTAPHGVEKRVHVRRSLFTDVSFCYRHGARLQTAAQSF
eukprot:TRINITY_DN5438_c0_g1_i1.p1 TRINITY_DN5438_c0_g1~~TRINITY_DN5438_c0_g1_i1.p1  ORF type:complete len:135 (-),score=2.55 TRINITY_DN5438_c0_g1_i1:178-582(-)